MTEPGGTVYSTLKHMERESGVLLSFTPGFPAADFPDCGASVFAYGRTQADADTAADHIAALIASHESDFDGRIFAPDDGVRFAMQAAQRAGRPPDEGHYLAAARRYLETSGRH